MNRPLENTPRGPRRVMQKIWADKDLRDELIAQIEAAVGQGAHWAAEIRIYPRDNGGVAVKLANIVSREPA